MQNVNTFFPRSAQNWGSKKCLYYTPFGVELKGRNFKKTGVGVKDYRYGYQGSEVDNEVKGDGNSYTTMFRMLDTRLGRWLSIDPLGFIFPSSSPYVSMDNCPIALSDVMGLETDKPKEGDTKRNDVDDGTMTYHNGRWDTVIDEVLITPKPKEVIKDLPTGENTSILNRGEREMSYPTWKTPVGIFLATLGHNGLSTRTKTKGATSGTSIASKYLSEKFPQQLNKTSPKIWKIATKVVPKTIFGMPLRSPVAGRMMGRFVPVLGWGLMILDVSIFTAEAIESIMNDSPQEYWRKARKNCGSVGMYQETQE